MEEEKIKKLMRGERVGTAFTAVCGAALIYFIICFSIARVKGIYALELTALISAPIIMAASVAVAAYCNIKFGGALDRLIKDYVRDVLVQNAALMHPERDSLTFYCAVGETQATLKVNAYKEVINFDFSAFKKLSLSRKADIAAAIEARICVTFCRLALERGVNYESVGYAPLTGKNKDKVTYIIKGGKIEKRAYKSYLKSKQK
ncbi:MAG: hypothetical protein HDP34_00255 [Clostridia bacterium]|nr:hypothetical protein [Clostridia bacterium]